MPPASDQYLFKRKPTAHSPMRGRESPETVAAVHYLYRGHGRVYLVGTPERFAAVLIENSASEEWMG